MKTLLYITWVLRVIVIALCSPVICLVLVGLMIFTWTGFTDCLGEIIQALCPPEDRN